MIRFDPYELGRQIAGQLSEASADYCRRHPLDGKPLVSVIMPCRNVAATIVPVLDSIKAQTWQNFEVFLNLDRRGWDESEEVLRAYVATDPRFKLIFDNTGMAQCRNAGRAPSHGDFILNLDADLALTPTVLEEALTRAQAEGEDIIVIPELSVPYSFWGNCRGLEKIGYLNDPLQECNGRFVRRK